VDARATTDTVDRELRRRQLAQRLVVHHARTQTIFRLTGLSRHQLATMRQRWGINNEIRRRGPAPTSFAVFRSTSRVREEAAALAVHWVVLASVGALSDRNFKSTAIEFGEKLCEVFEAYLAYFPDTELQFEHLVLLVRGLEEAEAVALSSCSNCDAVILADLLGKRRRLCSHCQHAPHIVSATGHASETGTEPNDPAEKGGAVQQELF